MSYLQRRLLFAGKGSLLPSPATETIIPLPLEIIHQRRDNERKKYDKIAFSDKTCSWLTLT